MVETGPLHLFIFAKMRLLFVRLAFGGVDGRDQQFLDFDTFIKYRLIVIISAFDQKFEPILALGTLFEGDLKFGNEIRFPGA